MSRISKKGQVLIPKEIRDALRIKTEDIVFIEAFVSPIVISEVLVGFYRNKEEIEAKKFLEHLLRRYKVRNVDIEVAKISAKLRD